MNTAKHTPGPWHIAATSGHIRDAHGITIAISHRPPATESEVRANAALIASAPDLLAENEVLRAQVQELREALETLVNCDRSTTAQKGTSHATRSDKEYALIKARAALTRITRT